MNIKIRQETISDFKQVFDLTERAFEKLEISDHTEQFLVERLRNSSVFVPELSLVAEYENKIVGHILLTKLKIINGKEEFQSLALAPVSVLPEYQNMGIGSKLIEAAHIKAREAGYKSVMLVGHPHYYPRFGYKKSSDFGIRQSFEAPDECCLAIELVENGLKGVSGTAEYPKEFFE
ncbi:MAG: N-acetyltransferase [Bacteroidales bacterium]|jgi:predicted N-acetyltransferase YhbS